MGWYALVWMWLWFFVIKVGTSWAFMLKLVYEIRRPVSYYFLSILNTSNWSTDKTRLSIPTRPHIRHIQFYHLQWIWFTHNILPHRISRNLTLIQISADIMHRNVGLLTGQVFAFQIHMCIRWRSNFWWHCRWWFDEGIITVWINHWMNGKCFKVIIRIRTLLAALLTRLSLPRVQNKWLTSPNINEWIELIIFSNKSFHQRVWPTFAEQQHAM